MLKKFKKQSKYSRKSIARDIEQGTKEQELQTKHARIKARVKKVNKRYE